MKKKKGEMRYLLPIFMLLIAPSAWADVATFNTAAAITDTTATQVAAATAGVQYFITDLSISNSHATVGTDVVVLCGSNIVDRCPAPSSFGGCVKVYQVGHEIPCGGNEAIKIQPLTSGASITATVHAITR